jgi:hypothetical protein
MSFSLLQAVRGRRSRRDGHLGGRDFQHEVPTSRISGCHPVPRRTLAASNRSRPPRRRDDRVLPRCLRGCVGEPVAEPQLVVGIAYPQPIVGIAHPEPVAITDFVSPRSVAYPDSNPDSNPESRSDPYSKRQAIADAQPCSKAFAQSPGDTSAGSEGCADIARRALPDPG